MPSQTPGWSVTPDGLVNEEVRQMLDVHLLFEVWFVI
jgi:hypothetical protein